MAEFSGKIISAQYIDAEYSMIKVTYEQDGMLIVYNLDANPDHPDYQDLLSEGWTQEKIIEETAEVKKAQAAAFNLEVMNAAQTLAREMAGMAVIEEEKAQLLSETEQVKKKLLDLDQTAKVRTKTVDAELYDYLLDKNQDKEELFKCKLWALELERVKQADKDVKSNIRKATRITQVMGIVDSLM